MNHRFLFAFCSATMLILLSVCCAYAGDLVVVMGASASPVTKDQVANVYLGRSTAFRPIDLPDSSEAHQSFYKKATGRDAAQVKAVWTRLIFTGGGKPPTEVADDAAVKKAVAADSKAIGYIKKTSIDSSVKVVLELE